MGTAALPIQPSVCWDLRGYRPVHRSHCSVQQEKAGGFPWREAENLQSSPSFLVALGRRNRFWGRVKSTSSTLAVMTIGPLKGH